MLRRRTNPRLVKVGQCFFSCSSLLQRSPSFVLIPRSSSIEVSLSATTRDTAAAASSLKVRIVALTIRHHDTVDDTLHLSSQTSFLSTIIYRNFKVLLVAQTKLAATWWNYTLSVGRITSLFGSSGKSLESILWGVSPHPYYAGSKTSLYYGVATNT